MQGVKPYKRQKAAAGEKQDVGRVYIKGGLLNRNPILKFLKWFGMRQ